MTKYSNEFKVKAIKMVLKGDSISHVAKIPAMPGTNKITPYPTAAAKIENVSV